MDLRDILVKQKNLFNKLRKKKDQDKLDFFEGIDYSAKLQENYTLITEEESNFK